VLLVAPFSAFSGGVELTDAHQFESSGAFDTPTAHAREVRPGPIENADIYRDEDVSAFDTPQATHAAIDRQNVNRADMYAFEQRDAYEFGPGAISDEGVEIAVFAQTAARPGNCIDWTE
jgi:hypothetical protein